jgi:hypothetical protein
MCSSARNVRFCDDTDNAANHSATAGTFLGQRPLSERPRNSESVGNALNAIAGLGDVLNVYSASSWGRIGTAGGKFGHMMIVVEEPRRVTLNSEIGRWLHSVWPDEAKELWSLQALEITRDRPGLHSAELLLLDGHNRNGSLTLLGELHDGRADMTDQVVEVWQIPENIKSTFNEVLFRETLEDMLHSGSKGWSWTTAARSVLKSQSHCLLDQTLQAERLLHDAKEAWDAEPICTSVVVAFWQRYLVKFAKVNNPPELNDVKAAELILQCMPLKADRCLPGDVMSAMDRCGWSLRVCRRRAESQRRSLCA